MDFATSSAIEAERMRLRRDREALADPLPRKKTSWLKAANVIEQLGRDVLPKIGCAHEIHMVTTMAIQDEHRGMTSCR